MQQLKFKFEGRKETLKIINAGIDDISSYLSNKNDICPLMGSEIVIGKSLGKGKYGEAFLVTIKSKGPKEYAVKKSVANIKIITLKTNTTAHNLSKKYNINLRSLLSINDSKLEYYQGETVRIPIYSRACLLKEDRQFPEIMNATPILKKGSIVCTDESYTEYAIGILCAELYRQHICIHFLDIYSFAVCTDSINNVYQYTFMEKINSTLEELLENVDLDEPEIEIIIIQTLFAIATYQRKLKLQHNDLSIKNVFIENVKTQKFNNQPINVDKFAYKIDSTVIVTQSLPYIIKIGDFGMSLKYSKPMIGWKKSWEGNKTYNVPNWYSPSYDVLFFLGNMFDILDLEFVNNCIAWAFGMPIGSTKDDILNNSSYFLGRPPLETLNNYDFFTAENILKNNSLMGFYHKPIPQNSVLLGEI